MKVAFFWAGQQFYLLSLRKKTFFGKCECRDKGKLCLSIKKNNLSTQNVENWMEGEEFSFIAYILHCTKDIKNPDQVNGDYCFVFGVNIFNGQK